eukprot:357860-Chlamydomonas_euryale.AAC.2
MCSGCAQAHVGTLAWAGREADFPACNGGPAHADAPHTRMHVRACARAHTCGGNAVVQHGKGPVLCCERDR